MKLLFGTVGVFFLSGLTSPFELARAQFQAEPSRASLPARHRNEPSRAHCSSEPKRAWLEPARLGSFPPLLIQMLGLQAGLFIRLFNVSSVKSRSLIGAVFLNLLLGTVSILLLLLCSLEILQNCYIYGTIGVMNTSA